MRLDRENNEEGGQDEGEEEEEVMECLQWINKNTYIGIYYQYMIHGYYFL